jgi:hypothetical protein
LKISKKLDENLIAVVVALLLNASCLTSSFGTEIAPVTTPASEVDVYTPPENMNNFRRALKVKREALADANFSADVQLFNERRGSFPASQPDKLCHGAEKIIFSCKANKKIISLCGIPSSGNKIEYIQYRFGEIGNIQNNIPSHKIHPMDYFKKSHASEGTYHDTNIIFYDENTKYVIYDQFSEDLRPDIISGKRLVRLYQGVAVFIKGEAIPDDDLPDAEYKFSSISECTEKNIGSGLPYGAYQQSSLLLIMPSDIQLKPSHSYWVK